MAVDPKTVLPPYCGPIFSTRSFANPTAWFSSQKIVAQSPSVASEAENRHFIAALMIRVVPDAGSSKAVIYEAKSGHISIVCQYCSRAPEGRALG